MITPERAYELLIERGVQGIDDPTVASYPIRWWFSFPDGVLCSAPWRAGVTRYPSFVHPWFEEPPA